jgi:hypothetical protein
MIAIFFFIFLNDLFRQVQSKEKRTGDVSVADYFFNSKLNKPLFDRVSSLVIGHFLYLSR